MELLQRHAHHGSAGHSPRLPADGCDLERLRSPRRVSMHPRCLVLAAAALTVVILLQQSVTRMFSAQPLRGGSGGSGALYAAVPAPARPWPGGEVDAAEARLLAHPPSSAHPNGFSVPFLADVVKGKRVVIVSHDMSPTGAPRVATELALILHGAGANVTVMVPPEGMLFMGNVPLLDQVSEDGLTAV